MLPTRTFEDLVRNRRTSLTPDPEAVVEHDTILELCELATWAPHHRRTNPWRFAIISGAGRRELGELVSQVRSRAGATPEKQARARSKFLRAPVVVIVASTEGRTAVETTENRDATAAGIQNLLLAATDRGLASFWSSLETAPEILQFCGLEPSAQIVAAVLIGQQGEPVEAPPRLPPVITVITGTGLATSEHADGIADSAHSSTA